MIRLVALFLFLRVAASAADLAPGLSYLRTTDPQAVAAALASGSVVLDLRAATEPVPAVRVPRTRVLLVLVSPKTPAATIPGAITLGRADPALKTDLAVTTTAEADDQAVAALASGSAPETLIVENTAKPRYDESRLVHEHRNGSAETPSDEAAPAASPGETPASAKPAEPPPKPVVDAVLQRAVHVYRGLVALKKIPAP